MDAIIVLLFLIFLIGMGIFMVKYARLLQSIVDYSNEIEVEIFGTRYKNSYHLMADISFINTLWAKDCHSEADNNQLSALLFKAHRMLRIQVYIGLLVFFIPLINSVVNIGAWYTYKAVKSLTTFAGTPKSCAVWRPLPRR